MSMRARRWPRWLYSAALYLLAPLVWRRVWREHALTNLRRERLGLIVPPPRSIPRIWLHCASVGEVQAAGPLINALLERYPGYHLVVTTMTATGAEQVHRLMAARHQTEESGRLQHAFVPLDFPGSARRFIARLRPGLAIFFETEIWPNLLVACQRQGVPTAVVNGRLSPRAMRGYRRLRPLMAAALDQLHWLAAKSREDAERFRELGMPMTRTDITGSLKYDLRIDAAIEGQSQQLCTRFGARPVWVAGSTHPGEDEQLLAAHAALRHSYPEALLILVPRHPQRFDAVASLVSEQGLRLARRSREEWPDEHTAVYLGDTMGELLLLYGAADLAFVGGSLVPVGGHNLLEPAAMGVPVLTGPELANFADVAETLRQGGALVEGTDCAMLADTLVTLFQDEAERQRLADAGLAVVATNRGALARIMAGLERLLPPPSE